jgi:aspartate beta-hydroxylase
MTDKERSYVPVIALGCVALGGAIFLYLQNQKGGGKQEEQQKHELEQKQEGRAESVEMVDPHADDDDRQEMIFAKLEGIMRTYGMSTFRLKFAMSWLRNAMSETNPDCDRLRAWLLLQLNKRKYPADVNSWQRGCPQIIPQLRAIPLWDASLLTWLEDFRKSYPTIKKELLSLRDANGFQPYRAPSWVSDNKANDGVGSIGTDAGNWNVYYLQLHNIDFTANCDRVPETMKLLEEVPGNYHHAFFSALSPATHITKHHGPTNKKLRCHLPLVVPEGCRLRVGDQVHTVEEGVPFVFDDSFEHEAWNDHPNEARIVLIVDLWHPDLHKKEIKFLEFLQKGSMKRDKKICQRAKEEQKERTIKAQGGEAAGEMTDEELRDNFFDIIEDARALLPKGAEAQQVWGSGAAEFNAS